jgi:hypothetical protein
LQDLRTEHSCQVWSDWSQSRGQKCLKFTDEDRVTLELFILLINRIVFVIGDSYLFLAGGEYPDGSANKSVMRYDTCLDVWTEVAPMNIARSEYTCV